jgi:hypothetical protein
LRGRRPGTAAILLAVAWLGWAGCAPQGNGRETTIAPEEHAGQAGVTMSDDAFDQVTLDTFEESDCTPRLESDDFEGIRIAMPAKVSAGKVGRLPLCGVWSFSNATLAKFPMVEDSLVFLARNVETHETATGNFRVHEDPAGPSEMQPDADAPPPPPPGDEPVIGDEDITTRGYFNFNLGRVWKVPARPGRWRVHLVLHDVLSNEVEFEVVK